MPAIALNDAYIFLDCLKLLKPLSTEFE
jgi:hypothetical protein